MTTDEINALGDTIRANRFHIRSEGVRALADCIKTLEPSFDRERWFARIQGKPWTPKTGAPCSCRPGTERDNCPQCEGTGQRIDFAKIRAAHATA